VCKSDNRDGDDSSSIIFYNQVEELKKLKIQSASNVEKRQDAEVFQRLPSAVADTKAAANVRVDFSFCNSSTVPVEKKNTGKRPPRLSDLHTFTAIDFETAQGYRWSICQTGIVRVEKGLIVDQKCWLNQPPDNYYWKKFTDIHGISSDMTRDCPDFGTIWPEIKPYIENQHVVAHNGFGFDFQCLTQTLNYYKLPQPVFTGHCTYKLYNDNLASLCARYKIELDHHNALSDARACAKLFMMRQGLTLLC